MLRYHQYLQANFFAGEKRTLKGNKQIKGAPKTIQNLNYRPSSFALSSDNVVSSDPLTYLHSSRHLGLAVKQLAPADLQSPLMAGKASNLSGSSSPSVQLKRNFGTNPKSIWGDWSFLVSIAGRITFITVIGCFLFTTFKLSRWDCTNPKMDRSTLSWAMNPSLDCKSGPACIDLSNIGGRFRKLLLMFKNLKHHPYEVNTQSSSPVDGLFPFMKGLHKRQMPTEEAEALVKQWQAIKAEALGPDHEIHSLPEVLAESMLAQVNTKVVLKSHSVIDLFTNWTY